VEPICRCDGGGPNQSGCGVDVEVFSCVPRLGLANPRPAGSGLGGRTNNSFGDQHLALAVHNAS
jgi:hypothetical protein